MGKANYRKITANTENYVKNPKRKKTRGERDFTIIMDYNGDSRVW